MNKQEKCDHKNSLPLYGRSQNGWVSTQKITEKMIFICEDCGILFKKIEDKKEVSI